MLHTTKALVLRTIRHTDSTLVLKAYTEAFGLRSYLVRTPKSARRPGTAALLQPLTRSELVVDERADRDLHQVREIRLRRPYLRVPGDAMRTAQLLFVQELLVRTLREESGDPGLWCFLEEALELLDSGGDVRDAGSRSGTAGNGLKIANSSDVTINGTVLDGMLTDGVIIELGSSNIELNGLNVRGATASGRAGLRLAGAVSDIRVNGGKYAGVYGALLTGDGTDHPEDVVLQGVSALASTEAPLRVIYGDRIFVIGGLYRRSTPAAYAIVTSADTGVVVVGGGAVLDDSYGVDMGNANVTVDSHVYVGPNFSLGITGGKGASTWGGVVQLQDRFLWIDSDGKVRVHSARPATPTSTASGTIVGTQS